MQYDVVVVGAGPAGSTAAKNLAEKGKKVLLIDKDKFPRDKPCGGGLPTRVVNEFAYVEELISSISYGNITFSSSLKYKFCLKRETPVVYTVLRKEFDYSLLKIAQQSGAAVKLGKKIVDVQRKNNHMICFFDDDTQVESKLVIGCDGMRSVVAEKTYLSQDKNNRCVCLVVEHPLNEIEMQKYFKKEKFIQLFIKTQGITGYGWIFPKKDTVNIGIGQFEPNGAQAIKHESLKISFENYLTMLKNKNIIPSTVNMDHMQGGILPIFPLKKTYADGVLLCGDAAGFINPITGEGIYYAMASATLAANIAVHALNEDTYHERFLSQYQDLWYSAFGKDLKLLGKFNKKWLTSSEKIVRLLSKDKTFARLIIGVTGGRIHISKYKIPLFTRYLYVLVKDMLTKK
ncbi:MAG: NAD(P)/FAD-dependent oxidoreductase [Thermoplasmatota archaeon]